MTEVVYRLYDVVDELGQVIENARSVPMSGSCMVPRDHLLDLLDELRENLPEEVQQAGRIVEQRTEILAAGPGRGRAAHRPYPRRERAAGRLGPPAARGDPRASPAASATS